MTKTKEGRIRIYPTTVAGYKVWSVWIDGEEVDQYDRGEDGCLSKEEVLEIVKRDFAKLAGRTWR